jgi:hypothetical protein
MTAFRLSQESVRIVVGAGVEDAPLRADREDIDGLVREPKAVPVSAGVFALENAVVEDCGGEPARMTRIKADLVDEQGPVREGRRSRIFVPFSRV